MSYSTIYRVYRTKVTPAAEFRNSWGTLPPLWGHMCQRFLGKGENAWLIEYPGIDQELSALFGRKDIPLSLRAATAFTFDKAVCPLDRVTEFADLLDEVSKITAKTGTVNHWAGIAKALRDDKPRRKPIGYAIGCTSVSDPWGDWNGEYWDIFEGIEEAS